MTRSNPIKKQFSTVTNASSDEKRIMNYQAAYTLQENNICLQNVERTMIKDVIDILSKCSKNIKDRQTEWHKVHTNKKNKLTEYEHLWHVFDAAVSSIDLYVKENNNIVAKLKSIQSSMLNENKHELLKDKIPQMRSTADKLYNEITDLEKQKLKLRIQVKQQGTSSWRNTLQKKVFRKRQSKSNEKLRIVSRSIKDKKKLYDNETKRFHQAAAKVIEENIKAESRRSVSMKQQLTDFVQSFNISSKKFTKELARCHPKQDLNQWKENILYQNVEQSSESSDEEEDDYEEKNHSTSEIYPISIK
ncbi:unnamed protein product [Rotaria sp. Silwood1]|nr:unnamed protein product [Rotaria sp. Silwood1]CAF1644344.1 unnamed protein product [Rotaria sp. Silwood1]